MNNYYEILEVSKNASKEIIEKAYKVLAKKYHPDLQQGEEIKKAEEKMKQINEAYEILSDDEKRKQYDIKLEQIEQEKIRKIQEQAINSQNSTKNLENEETYNNNYNSNYNREYRSEKTLTKEEFKKQIKQERKAQIEYQEEQERNYRNYLRSLGYRVKEQWTWKKTLKLLEILGVLIVIIFILWLLPPTRKIIIETYENNPILKTIVDVFINIFKGIANGIYTFFKGIFSKN